MLRLADLLSDIASEHGYYYNSSADTDFDSDTTNKPRQKYIKRRINEAYMEILGYMPRDFLRVERPILVPGVYDTGTAGISSGYFRVTGVGVTFTRYMQMRQILFSGERRPYFIKTFVSGMEVDVAHAYGEGLETGQSYKIGCWAIPLPSDFLAPVETGTVWHPDNGCEISLINRQQFRKAWPTTYSTGTPTCCCIDGLTQFARRNDTADVTNGSATVTLDNYSPIYEDVGSIVKIAGDSIIYTITDVGVIGGTLTVSPVVQRANGDSVAIEIDPAPLPLLWLNMAPTDDTPLLLRYVRIPQPLWTDEQRVELPRPFEAAMTAYAKYLACMYLSRDTLAKQEALGRWQLALSGLPQRTDLSTILKEVNVDAHGYHYDRRDMTAMYNHATE